MCTDSEMAVNTTSVSSQVNFRVVNRFLRTHVNPSHKRKALAPWIAHHLLAIASSAVRIVSSRVNAMPLRFAINFRSSCLIFCSQTNHSID